MEAKTDERLTYTVDEVAKLLGLSRGAAFAAVKAGTIPSVRVGWRILIPKQAFDRWLDEIGQPNER